MDQKAFQTLLKDALKNELSPLLIGIRNDFDTLATTLKENHMQHGLGISLSAEAVKEMKHHDGKTPKKGVDYFTDTEANEFLKAATPTRGKDYFTQSDIESFKTAVTPKKGVDYFDGENGRTPIKGTDYFTAEEVRAFLEKVTPKKGVHYFDGKDAKGRDGTEISPEQIRNKLESLTGASRLDVKAIKGMTAEVQRHLKNFQAPPAQGGGLGGSGSGSGSSTPGATAFIGLTDVPATFVGSALKAVRVNAAANALEFFTLSGGGDALTASPLSQFAATTSLQLKGVISDETGSGALVFATSPTLSAPIFSSIVNTGTLTLPTSTDTLVARATTDNLTNKTITAGILSACTITTSLLPTTDDGAAIGSSTQQISDFFLASGGVIAWATSAVTITHAANNLTFQGGSSGYQFDSLVAPNSNGGAPLGSTALGWSSGFFSSGAALNFGAGNYTLVHSAGLLTTNGPLTIGGATVVADTVGAGSGALAGSAVSVTQTWNTSGAPTAIKLNVTNTGSGAAALLMDLQIGAVSQFKVDKAGVGTFAGALNTGGAITTSFNISGNNGLFSSLIRLGATFAVNWNGRSNMFSPADGIILLQNNGATDFTRLQFGGTTSSFPSLKRSTTVIQARLADDSAYAEFQAAAGTSANSVATIDGTQTLTNKRITKRTGTTTSSATPTINTDNVDFYSITALTVDITSFTTNLSGTPTEAQTLWIAITGTAARAITWGASFESSTATLPTTTVTTARLDVGFVWNTITSKWRCIAVA